MRKPVYQYPDFVKDIRLKKNNDKRYWLRLIIDQKKTEGILVILKNPSRANQMISDKTVYNVANYIYRNRRKHDDLQDIGDITILNLIPNYLTDSGRLQNFRNTLIDPENLSILTEFCRNCKKVIIAWGNPPKGLYKEYQVLVQSVMRILHENKNQIYYVDKMSLSGHPKHGQVWGYDDMLRKYKKGSRNHGLKL
ncbi:MAG: DUF1643 domain-containing protein [Eudoraea sp.]|nr:DUF1643 domain-containing protein [Eudoraea sp.]